MSRSKLIAPLAITSRFHAAASGSSPSSGQWSAIAMASSSNASGGAAKSRDSSA